MGLLDADHEETAPNASTLVINRQACSLVGTVQTIKISPGSFAYQAYGRSEVAEQFYCNYGVNPQFRDKFAAGTLRVTGYDPNGEISIIELADHPFYVATLFLPQISSGPGKPHPLIMAYLKAALDLRNLLQRESRSNA